MLVNILFNSLNAKVTFIYLRSKSSDWFLYNGNFGINELNGVCFEQTEPFTSLLKATYSSGFFD